MRTTSPMSTVIIVVLPTDPRSARSTAPPHPVAGEALQSRTMRWCLHRAAARPTLRGRRVAEYLGVVVVMTAHPAGTRHGTQRKTGRSLRCPQRHAHQRAVQPEHTPRRAQNRPCTPGCSVKWSYRDYAPQDRICQYFFEGKQENSRKMYTLASTPIDPLSSSVPSTLDVDAPGDRLQVRWLTARPILT